MRTVPDSHAGLPEFEILFMTNSRPVLLLDLILRNVLFNLFFFTKMSFKFPFYCILLSCVLQRSCEFCIFFIQESFEKCIMRCMTGHFLGTVYMEVG